MNFPGGFVVFLFFLASEERVPKQLKQVSIVGITPVVLGFRCVNYIEEKDYTARFATGAG